MTTVAVLPALNEEAVIARVVAELAEQPLDHIVVVDNGSSDATAALARSAGAVVVSEPRRGYGAAMLAGLRNARELGADVVVMLDADGSDDPDLLPILLAALTPGVDMVLGARDPRRSEPGSLSLQQRIGNALASRLMAATVGARYADLPPFKVVRQRALDRLRLDDHGHGFTIQLLLEAHRAQLGVVEVPVACRRRRGGSSKVSGTVRGTVRAGTKIIGSILLHAARYHSGPRTR